MALLEYGTSWDILLSNGPSIAINTKTIGANLNPLINDWQTDFAQSRQAGVEWGKRAGYYTFARSIEKAGYITSVQCEMNLYYSALILFLIVKSLAEKSTDVYDLQKKDLKHSSMII